LVEKIWAEKKSRFFEKTNGAGIQREKKKRLPRNGGLCFKGKEGSRLIRWGLADWRNSFSGRGMNQTKGVLTLAF